jgi:group I intron endonuclease
MTIGIYAIRNKINQKMYIGKSINIERRFWSHKNSLSKPERNKKQTNRFLWNAVQKYGIDNFEFLILESITHKDDDYLAELELFYMDFYNSTDKDHGYNLRRDSSTKMKVHEETRKLISDLNRGSRNPNYGNRWTQEMRNKMSEQKKEWAKNNPITEERRKQISETSSAIWKDEDKKNSMARKVAKATSTLRFYQYDKNTMELVKVWEYMDDILQENPNYHRIAIYSVCNGHKKSYRGYIWKSELKE